MAQNVPSMPNVVATDAYLGAVLVAGEGGALESQSEERKYGKTQLEAFINCNFRREKVEFTPLLLYIIPTQHARYRTPVGGHLFVP
jgi:hypothetical protein